MATLFNTKISATYEGLFKTIDNAAITASLKELTDGSGNQSGLYVNNAGDFKVSNILEWGSLKDTGTGVTITRYVTSTDGIENFDNNTSLPTSAAVKLYVDSKFATSDTLEEVLSFGNTTGANNIVIQKSIQLPTTTTNNGTPTDVGVISFGGTFSNGNRIFNDSSGGNLRIQGTDNLQLFAPNHKISNVNGSLIIAGDTGVKLYYQNSQKLQTTTSGIDVTGNLVVSGTITGSGGSFLPLAGGTMTGNTLHGDSVKSLYGTGNDLEVYHDGTHAVVNNTTGNVYLSSLGAIFLRTNTNETSLLANANGNLELYYNNSKKFETSSTGVSVTGALSTTTDVTVGANATFLDNGKAIFGAGSDLQIYHDGSISKIIESTSELQISSAGSNLYIQSITGENGIKLIPNDSVELYYDNAKKIETLTDGAKVTGNLEVTGTITGAGGSFLPLIGGTMTGDTIHNDNVKSIYGTGSDLEIYHSGSDSYIKDSGTGDVRIVASATKIFDADQSHVQATFIDGGSVDLYYSGNKKFATTSTGISVTGNGVFSGNVTIPNAGELLLGSSGGLKAFHDGSLGFIRNSIGDFYVDQLAVTQSIIFRVSDANPNDTTALTISRNADASFGRNVTIAGDLTVNGTTTTVNSQTLAVVDPLIQLAKDNTANSLDIGLYGDYNDGTDRFLGLFSDASDGNKFKLFKGTTVEPTTTVNIGATGYEAADLVVAGLEATTISTSGTVSVGNTLYVTEYIQHLGDTNNNIRFQTGRMILQSKASGSAKIDLHDNGSLFLNSGGGTALTLDTSQNATFVGEVTTSGEIKIVDSSATGNPKLSFYQTTNERGYIQYADSGEKLIVDSDSSLILNTNNLTRLTIDSTGASTFAGDVTINTGELYVTADSGINTSAKFESGAGSTINYLQLLPNGASDTDSGYIGYDTSNNLKLFTQNTLAVTIDSLQNSTFAGSIGVGGIAASGGYMVDIAPSGGNIIRSTRGTSVFGSYQSNNSDVYLGTISNNTFKIITNDTTAITIDNSQNSTFAGSVSAGAGLQLYTDGSGNGVIYNLGQDKDLYFVVDDGGTGVNALVFDSSNGGAATFAGNIGIGAAPVGNPGTNILAVGTAGTTAGGIQLWAANNQAHYLQFGDANSGGEVYRGGIGYNHSSETLLFLQNSSTALSFTGSQAATFAGNVTVNGGQDALTINTTDTDGPYAVWKNTTNATLGYVGNANSLAAAGNTNFAVRATNDLIFASGGGTERLRITSGGELQYTGNGVIRNEISDGNYSYWFQSSSEVRFAAQYAQPLTFYNNGAERMRIDSSGNTSFEKSVTVKETLNVTPTGNPTNIVAINARAANDYANIQFRSNDGLSDYHNLIADSSRVTLSRGNDKVYDPSAYQGDFIIQRKNNDGANQVVSLGFAVTGYIGQTTGEAFISATQPTNASSADLIFGTRETGTRSEKMRITSGGDLNLKEGGNFYSGQLRNDSVTVNANTSTTVLDFTGETAGIYIITVCRSGVSVGENLVCIVAWDGSGGNVLTTLTNAGFISPVFVGTSFRVSNGNNRNCHATAQPLSLS